jgi:hypothetical protein
MKKTILNYVFLVEDYEKFVDWLSKGYVDGVFVKEEQILKEVTE